MKNIKMLLLPVAMLSIVGVANGFRLKDYMVGSQIDKEGRTIFHIAAQNCNDLRRLKQRLLEEAMVLSMSEPNREVSKESPSILAKDNKGRTALDIAEAKYEETKHSDCMKLLLEFREQIKQDELAEDHKKLNV